MKFGNKKLEKLFISENITPNANATWRRGGLKSAKKVSRII
jgi:hypothetical protein